MSSDTSTVEHLGSTTTIRFGDVSDRKEHNNSRRIAIKHNEKIVPILGWPDEYDSEGVYEIRGANQIATIYAEVKGSSIYLLGQSDVWQKFYYLTRHDLATGVQTGTWDSGSFSFKTDPAQTAYITIFEDNWAPYEGTPYAYLKDDFLKFRQEFSFLSIPAHGTGEIITENGTNDLLKDGWLDEITPSVSTESSDATWNTLSFQISITARDIVVKWLSGDASNQKVLVLSGVDRLDIQASSWSDMVKLKSVAQASSSGGRLEAPQIDDLRTGRQGSVLNGSDGRDQIYAKAGWDVIDGGAGNDFIRAGNGRDIITGGAGADELWGDFGWNTYRSEKDGARDLIVIKSDQNLVNWLYGKAGNNPNGEKADIIEGLDSNDAIKIVGASTESLSFRNASAHGLSGIGIFAGSALEALYTGGDLSIAQIQAMTSGDASAAAMNNTLDGYGWTG